MAFTTLLQSLAGTRIVSAGVDAGFGLFARRRSQGLDHRDAVQVQRRTLLDLVAHARGTRFGRDHDFAGIRTIDDYRRRVPLRDYDAFWKDYWQPAFPHVADVTWPGRVPYFALSSGTTTGSTKYIPVSRDMLASNRKAALTMLAWLKAAHPQATLFRGRMFFLGGSTDLRRLSTSDASANRAPLAGDLSGIAALEVPSLLRPFTFPPLEVALLQDWERKLELLARKAPRFPSPS